MGIYETWLITRLCNVDRQEYVFLIVYVTTAPVFLYFSTTTISMTTSMGECLFTVKMAYVKLHTFPE